MFLPGHLRSRQATDTPSSHAFPARLFASTLMSRSTSVRSFSILLAAFGVVSRSPAVGVS